MERKYLCSSLSPMLSNSGDINMSQERLEMFLSETLQCLTVMIHPQITGILLRFDLRRKNAKI